MLTAALRTTVATHIDNVIKANGNREITGPILNEVLQEMLAAIEYTLVSGATAPVSEPERRLWRSTVNGALYFKNLALPGSPFVEVRKHYFAKDFGATGLGSADDSAAIQAGIDYVSGLGGGILYVEAGTFKCNVVLKSGVTISGSGSSTIFRPNVDQPVFRSAANVVLLRSGIECLTIWGNTAHTTSGYGVYLGPSVPGTTVVDFLLRDVEIHHTGQCGILMETSLASAISNVVIDNVLVRDCIMEGLRITGGTVGVTVTSSDFVANGGSGNNFTATPFGGLVPEQLNFLGCEFKGFNTSSTACLIGGVTSAVFLSCKFSQGAVLARVNGALNKNIRFSHCTFSCTFSIVRYVLLTAVETFTLTDCYFQVLGSVSYPIDQDGETVDVKSVTVRRNTYEGTFTRAVNLGTGVSIAAGIVPVLREYTRLRTEASAATDDLVTIQGYAGGQPFSPGQTVYFQLDTDGQEITFKHGTGNLVVIGGEDFVLNDMSPVVTAVFNGLRWVIFPPAGATTVRSWSSGLVSVGGNVPVTFTHNLGTKNLVVTVWNAADEVVGAYTKATTIDTIQITATVTTDVRVVVHR